MDHHRVSRELLVSPESLFRTAPVVVQLEIGIGVILRHQHLLPALQVAVHAVAAHAYQAIIRAERTGGHPRKGLGAILLNAFVTGILCACEYAVAAGDGITDKFDAALRLPGGLHGGLYAGHRHAVKGKRSAVRHRRRLAHLHRVGAFPHFRHQLNLHRILAEGNAGHRLHAAVHVYRHMRARGFLHRIGFRGIEHRLHRRAGKGEGKAGGAPIEMHPTVRGIFQIPSQKTHMAVVHRKGLAPLREGGVGLRRR